MDKDYKIREFARHLGVSTGFLKYHESYGSLKPRTAESGYRYYRREDGMQVLNCLKLQGMGFSSREIADILENAASEHLPGLLLQQQEVLKRKIALYQETLQYMQDIIKQSAEVEACGGESHAIKQVEPFYYLENMQEGIFVNDDQVAAATTHWNELMPLIEHCSHLQDVVLTENGVHASDYAMGLCVRKSHADPLDLYTNAAVRLVEPGRCLVYRRHGLRTSGQGQRSISMDSMLSRPLDLCRRLDVTPTGEAYVIKAFCSLANDQNHVRETVMLPLTP